MVSKLVADAEERMKKSLEAVRRELATIRSGKASPALLDTVRVEAYGQPVPIQQVGSISEPEPRLLVVQPWGVHVRQVRHDLNKDIKAQEHDGRIPEDEAKRLTAEVQKLTDRYISMIDDLLKKKTAEVMEV